MQDGEFTVIFDLAKEGYREWWFPAFGLIFVAVGFAIPALTRCGIFRKQPPLLEKWFSKIFLAGALLWTGTVFLSTFGDYLQDRRAFRKGEFSYVEGKVENFLPMPCGGHAMESFTVQGVPFSYSDYVVTPGFNRTTSHGGPLHQGAMVRIWYRGNDILKLEVRPEPATP